LELAVRLKKLKVQLETLLCLGNLSWKNKQLESARSSYDSAYNVRFRQIAKALYNKEKEEICLSNLGVIKATIQLSKVYS